MESSDARTGPADREVYRFLNHEMLPALRRARLNELVRAVQQSVDEERLSDLGQLPERLRRDLLETVERSLDRHRTAIAPRALVRLTTLVAAHPSPDLPSGRWRTSPGR